MAKIFSKGIITVKDIELYSSQVEEIVILQLQNVFSASIVVKKNSEIIDDAVLGDGDKNAPNERELKINMNKGDKLYAISNKADHINYILIV